MSELEPTSTELEPTATERLRALLTERGVEWKEHRHVMPGSMAIQRETLWGQPTDVASGNQIPHVYHYRATEMGDGRLFLEAQLIAPEQAIAATLGSCNCSNNCTNSERTETCQMEYVSDWMSWHCKACDQMDMAPRNPKPRYCKWCGRKVVDDG